MRRFILTIGLAALLGSSGPSSVAMAAAQASNTDITTQASSRQKKNSSQSYENNKVDAQILEIARAERGEDGVYVRVQTTKPDMKCSMKVKFFDGSVASPPRSMADANGVCVLHFDVPARGDVVGPALLKVDVLNKRNDVRAKLVQDFAVFDTYRR